jgi:hypothetical protein
MNRWLLNRGYLIQRRIYTAHWINFFENTFERDIGDILFENVNKNNTSYYPSFTIKLKLFHTNWRSKPAQFTKFCGSSLAFTAGILHSASDIPFMLALSEWEDLFTMLCVPTA